MFLSGAIVVVGGLAVAVWALLSVALQKRRILRLSQNPTEKVFMVLAVIATLCGSGYLFQTQFPGPVSPEGSHIRIESSPATAPDEKVILEGDEARQWQRERRRGAAIFFSLPVVVSLFPLIFYAVSIRPFFQALVAALLAAQIGIGMSGYGILFVPGALFMLLAAIISLRAVATQQVAAGDV